MPVRCCIYRNHSVRCRRLDQDCPRRNRGSRLVREKTTGNCNACRNQGRTLSNMSRARRRINQAMDILRNNE